MASSWNSQFRKAGRDKILRDIEWENRNTMFNNSFHSVVSSTGSQHGTVSPDSTLNSVPGIRSPDFDPERDGALMSTQIIDENFSNSQDLPPIRDTAKKYGRWSPNREPNVVINTSAIGRAFQDFTSGNMSDESRSLEALRAGKSILRQSTPANKQFAPSEATSPVITVKGAAGDTFTIHTTPKRGSHKQAGGSSNIQTISSKSIFGSKKQANQHSETRSTINNNTQKNLAEGQKENLAPAGDTSRPDYISNASRAINGERRTLAELHAKVTDDSESSFVADQRPTTSAFHAKATRFSQPRTQSPLAQSSHISTKRDRSAERLSANVARVQEAPAQQQTITTSSTGPNPTQQSFLLPNHDQTELVNGLQDGRVVSNTGVKVQPRFLVTETQNNAGDSDTVDQEEKDIYFMIETLQEEIAELKKGAGIVRTENAILKDDVVAFSSANSRLKAENVQLQARLDEFNTRGDVVKTLREEIANLKKARDTTKTENLRLQDTVDANHDTTARIQSENNQLRARLNNLQTRRDSAYGDSDEERGHITGPQANNATLKAVERELELTKIAHERQIDALQSEHNREISRIKKNDRTLRLTLENDELKSQIAELKRELEATKADQHHSSEWQTEKATLQNRITGLEHEMEEMKANHNYEIARLHETVGRMLCSSNVRLSQAGNEATQDQSLTEITMSVVPEDRTIGSQRHVAEGDTGHFSVRSGRSDRTARSTRSNRTTRTDRTTRFEHAIGSTNRSTTSQSVAAELKPRDETVNLTTGTDISTGRRDGQEDATGRAASSAAHRRRSAPDNLTIQSTASSSAEITNEVTASGNRRRSESGTSAHRLRRVVSEDMTSAFIIPDISRLEEERGSRPERAEPKAKSAAKTTSERPITVETSGSATHTLCEHRTRNCTVCSRVISHGDVIQTRTHVPIERPVPVSDRVTVTQGQYEDEPTMRPSTDPGLALATVIKGLQDEHLHLQLRHSVVSDQYKKHDVSKGARQRKALLEEMKKLTTAIEVKADQIYNLFNVLEGQKAAGQLMTDQEVEVTLLNVGLDPADYDLTVELPWEGFEEEQD